MDDFTMLDAGGGKIAVRKDLRVPMRDGIELAADAYQGTEDKPRPALVALSPYGKELQALALTTPPQRRPSPMWDGCIEAGDIARIVAEDYVHVIGDLRGSGHSEGEHIGNYNAGGVSLGQDAYDFIEWVAAQPWCDGNVGMVGISYFGSMQVLAAAERPPSLKAIFVSGGHYDFYETTYHGGIMWFMPRAAREGRGGDSGWAFTDRVKSRMIEKYSPEELKELVQRRLQDPDVAAWPNLVHVLHYPTNHEAWFDIVMNELDGQWYEERNPVTLAPNIDIPVWLQIDQGRGWTMDGTIELFNSLKGPEKLTSGPTLPCSHGRSSKNMTRCSAGTTTGSRASTTAIMDEPAVSVFVEGSRELVTADQWPPKDIEYTSLYLRPRGKLSGEPEPMGSEYAVPDGFYQAPSP
jgi:putative CocE/NonD family hydrolase